tara:strand:+ start:244 stop:837 length:594 start_codon:yes stop_codon:yes gene_type:complete
MSQIPELMGGRSLSHPLPLSVGAGKKMYVGGQANADVAAGTTTAESSAENKTAQYTIPANTLVAGSTIRCRWVTATSAVAGGTDNLTVRLRFGSNGTTMTSDTECAVSTAVDQDNTSHFSVGDMIIQIRSATKAVAFGTISDSDVIGSKLVSAQFEPEFTIDTTVDNYVSVSTEFGNANANLAATQGFVVDIVNPGV